MSRRRSSFRLLALILTFGVAALPMPVFASGFQLFEQNASGLGNAYAGQAAGIKDASAIHFNPAALTRTKGWNIVVSAETIGLSNKFSDTGSTVPTAPGYPFPVPLGNEGDDAGGWIPVPNGYVSGQVTDRIWLGVGLNVPFGLETDWDQAWMGRFHATKSKVEARTVTPTIAIQLSDTLSIGAGAAWQDLDADFNSAVAYGGLSYAGTAQAVAGLPPGSAAAAPALGHGPAENALCPSGRLQSAADHRSWIGAGECSGFLPALSGTILPGYVQTHRDAAQG